MRAGFLYIDPLKQGLKLTAESQGMTRFQPFLYIVPLKQGLKQPGDLVIKITNYCFYT